jgi:hypothetical protein
VHEIIMIIVFLRMLSFYDENLPILLIYLCLFQIRKIPLNSLKQDMHTERKSIKFLHLGIQTVGDNFVVLNIFYKDVYKLFYAKLYRKIPSNVVFLKKK